MVITLSSAGKAALDQLVAQATEDPNFPGFVFGVTTAEEEIYFSGGGHQVLNDPSSGDITPESVFFICSQTKLITHLAALQLIERGHLHLDDPVSKYVPEFTNLIVLDDVTKEQPSYTPAKEVVTVKHLLNVTCGLFYPLKDIAPGMQLVQYSAPHNKEDPIGEFFRLVKGKLPGIPLQFEPGTNFSYGFGSDVLGFVIERASKLTLEEYFKENIFDPLKIELSFYPTPDLMEKLVALTIRRNEKIELYDPNIRVGERDPEKVHLRLGGTGLYSSARDYLTFLRHLLQISAGTAKRPVFSKEVVSSIFTPALNEAGQASLTDMLKSLDPFSPWEEGVQWSSACAVNMTDWPGRRKKGSGNWFGWANTYHFIDPTTGVAAVFDTQVLPVSDSVVTGYFARFETELYKGLDIGS